VTVRLRKSKHCGYGNILASSDSLTLSRHALAIKGSNG